MMQTLIIVLAVLFVAFTGCMIAICRIEAEEDERMMGTDEGTSGAEGRDTEDLSDGY